MVFQIDDKEGVLFSPNPADPKANLTLSLTNARSKTILQGNYYW